MTVLQYLGLHSVHDLCFVAISKAAKSKCNTKHMTHSSATPSQSISSTFFSVFLPKLNLDYPQSLLFTSDLTYCVSLGFFLFFY